MACQCVIRAAAYAAGGCRWWAAHHAGRALWHQCCGVHGCRWVLMEKVGLGEKWSNGMWDQGFARLVLAHSPCPSPPHTHNTTTSLLQVSSRLPMTLADPVPTLWCRSRCQTGGSSASDSLPARQTSTQRRLQRCGAGGGGATRGYESSSSILGHNGCSSCSCLSVARL